MTKAIATGSHQNSDNRKLDHYARLTPAELERLAMLQEECAEVQKVIGKILRHGYSSYHPEDPEKQTNRSLLEQEIGHVLAVVELMRTAVDDIDPDVYAGNIVHHQETKQRAVAKWVHHQAIDPQPDD